MSKVYATILMENSIRELVDGVVRIVAKVLMYFTSPTVCRLLALIENKCTLK